MVYHVIRVIINIIKSYLNECIDIVFIYWLINALREYQINRVE